MTELSDDAVKIQVKLMAEGTCTEMLAWDRRRWPPAAGPVWYVVEDGLIVLNTGADSAKARARRR